MTHSFATPDKNPSHSAPQSTPEQINEKDAQRFAETDKRLEELKVLIEKLRKEGK